FTGAMSTDPSHPPPPPTGPPPFTPASAASGGEPVDLATGLFVLTKTDLYLPDVIPLALTRTYRPGDAASRAFGIGTTHPYDVYPWSAKQYEQVDLVLPDGSKIHYVRTSPGTGPDDAVFEHTGSDGSYRRSKIAWNGNGWDLSLCDGSTLVFGEAAPLNAI